MQEDLIYQSRRDFLISFSFSVMGSVMATPIVRIVDTFTVSEKESTPYFEEMFPEWKSFKLFPGKSHPIYGQVHPDIVIAHNKLIDSVKPVNATYEYYRHRIPDFESPYSHNFLIGGPLSNEYSRKMRGFNFLDQSKILTLANGPKSYFRWEFEYAPYDGISPKPSRFIDGKIYSSEPKKIIDYKNFSSITRYGSKINPIDNMMLTDYLLITYMPNLFLGSQTDFTILDIADLHGVGDQSFIQIIEKEELRKEFYEATFKKGIKNFQLLYEVPVVHDHKLKITTPKAPRLLDVHEII